MPPSSSGSSNSMGFSSSSYSISGMVTPAVEGSGTTVTLSGKIATTTSCDSSSNYTFCGLPSGVYVVTPSHTGYSFSPEQQAITITNASVSAIDFTASTLASYTVELSWEASASVVVGYNVYRGTSDGGPYTRINSAPITTIDYTDGSVTSGNVYYYVSTAVDSSGTESAYSNQATADIP